ncbi:hypothetical protein AB0M54_05790 [Actinoplanes sp. NPDC051470]|uniref:hypothetical protein n=1 Tax=Actinoplanes sp. NPDC051470 TaxID=3157224 RepID=UPI003427199E
MRDVLKSLESTPPPPAQTTTDDIIGRARRARAWQSVALGSGVAAVLAVAVAVGVTTLGGPGGAGPGGVPAAGQPTPQSSFSPPPAERIDPPLPVKKVSFSTDLGAYRVGAFRIGPAAKITDGYVELPVYHDGITLGEGSTYPLAVATITVYDKDVYDTSTFGGAGNATLIIGDHYPMTVGGREALGRDWTYISPVDESKKRVMAALAWQYDDGAWATLLPNYGGPDLPRDQAAQIAAGLTTAGKQDLRVPYRFGYLPDGWQAVAVRQTPADTSEFVSEVFLHKGPVADPATRIDEVLPGHLQITVLKGLDPGKADYTDKEGVHCTPGRESCAVVHDDYRIGLHGNGSTLSDAEIKKIAEGLQLRDLADQSKWAKVDF